MKKILWIVGTGIVCVLYAFLVGMIAIVANIITSIGTHSEIPSVNQDILNPVMVFGWAVLVIIPILMWKRWKIRCPACRRWGAVGRVKTELLKQEEISVRMELEHRNFNRQVTGTHDQYIPGKRKTYQDTYKCKHCGHSETRIRTEKRASI